MPRTHVSFSLFDSTGRSRSCRAPAKGADTGPEPIKEAISRRILWHSFDLGLSSRFPRSRLFSVPHMLDNRFSSSYATFMLHLKYLWHGFNLRLTGYRICVEPAQPRFRLAENRNIDASRRTSLSCNLPQTPPSTALDIYGGEHGAVRAFHGGKPLNRRPLTPSVGFPLWEGRTARIAPARPF